LLREAIARDPRFAEAHYALADTYLELGESGELPARDALPASRQAALRAVALEDLASTRIVLGAALFYHDWDWEGARREFAHALALEPDSGAVLITYARFLSAAGEHAQALTLLGRAEMLCPGCDLVVHEKAWAHYRAHRFGEAVRAFQRAAELGPPRFTDAASWRRANRFMALRVHLRAGDWPAAAEDAAAVLQLLGRSPDPLRRAAVASPQATVRRFVEGSCEFMERLAEQHYVAPTAFAALRSLLGQDIQALDWLERAERERAPSLVYSLADPDYDRLRDHPRFQALAARVALPERPRPLVAGALAALQGGPAAR
jgi:tetratricopeptide (TPR) repeat protein